MKTFTNFKELANNTLEKIMDFGIKSKTVIKYHKRCIKQLNLLMNEKGITVFDKELALKWLETVEGDLNSKTVYWNYRRTILLLYDNFNGNLNEWKIYFKNKFMDGLCESYLKILKNYQEHLKNCTYERATIDLKLRCAKNLLKYLESINIYNLKECTHKVLSNYFTSEHFKNRKPSGINAEIIRTRHFIIYLEEKNLTSYKNLAYALPTINAQEKRIVTTISDETEKALLDDYPNLPTNLRDKAAYLLALHCGLRTSDIINLKFSNINWNRKIINIIQKKTGIYLEIPVDNETLNAIIDYILNERRQCNLENIFISSMEPIRPLTRQAFVGNTRSKQLPSNIRPAHTGLHIMRRTYASKLLNKGVALPIISSALGHIDKEQVHKYLSTNETKMKLCALEIIDYPYKGVFLK